MKRTIIYLTGFLLIFSILNCTRDKVQDPVQEAQLSFYCTPELYDLASAWAGVYSKLNPGAEIEVIPVSGSMVTEILDGTGKLGFLSGAYDSAMYAASLWKVTVGRDVVVPVIHSENPYLGKIRLQGISPAAFAYVMDHPGTATWGSLLGNSAPEPVKLFMLDDPAVRRGMARFVETFPAGGSGVYGSDPVRLVEAVRTDPYALGICRITDVTDPDRKGLLENVSLLPIDKNGNGRVDYKEDVYADLDLFARGVWLGKYPRELSCNIYAASVAPPAGSLEPAFLKWAITDGQVLLDNHGFSDLESSERMASVRLIDGYGQGTPLPNDLILPKDPGPFNKYLPILLALAVVLVFLAIPGVAYLKNRNVPGELSPGEPKPLFDVGFVESPPGLYYDKTHTWAFMDEDGLVRIGIDDFLQHITGPLTRVKMKEPGERIKKGKHVLSIIQDGKQLDICAPVSGTIREQNRLLTEHTSLINSSPYGRGWVYKIEPTNWFNEIQFLIMGSSYREWLKSEFQRLKEFLSDTLRPETVAYAPVLQDGGALKDRILEELGPEVWEDFQTNFMDQSL